MIKTVNAIFLQHCSALQYGSAFEYGPHWNLPESCTHLFRHRCVVFRLYFQKALCPFTNWKLDVIHNQGVVRHWQFAVAHDECVNLINPIPQMFGD